MCPPQSYGINLSQAHDEKLTEMLQMREGAWLKQNKEAIDKYNNRVKKSGVFSEKIRRF